MKTKHLELYTDYLMVNASGCATATGLSTVMEGEVSHDQITRLLSKQEFTSKNLWLEVKSTVRQVEQEEACLIFDDTIQEKQWTDENEIMCWHYSHAKGRCIKGVNLLTCLVRYGDIALPIAYEPICKQLIITNNIFTFWLHKLDCTHYDG